MTQSRRSPMTLVIAGVIAVAAIAAIGGLAYLFLRGDPPAPVGVASPAPGSSASAAPVSTGVASTIGAGGLDGTWTVDTSIGSFADFSSSFVGYRVNETFTDQKANERSSKWTVTCRLSRGSRATLAKAFSSRIGRATELSTSRT